MFNSIADAVKALGEARTLNYINAHAKNMQYRADRNRRIQAEDQANRALIAKAQSDPRFADLFGKAKKTA